MSVVHNIEKEWFPNSSNIYLANIDKQYSQNIDILFEIFKKMEKGVVGGNKG